MNWEGEMRITESLRIEHNLLRNMLEAMSRWLTESIASDKLRERAMMLEAALNIHSVREERRLFAPLSASSDIAHDLVTMIESVHREVHQLFKEVADPANDPKNRLREILRLTNVHFAEEETGLFPLAEKLLPAELLEDHDS
jgi:hemerythrin-like domain-containing protein